MIDTCQAESMFQKFYSPNILAVASSKIGEDSLSVCHTSVIRVMWTSFHSRLSPQSLPVYLFCMSKVDTFYGKQLLKYTMTATLGYIDL